MSPPLPLPLLLLLPLVLFLILFWSSVLLSALRISILGTTLAQPVRPSLPRSIAALAPHPAARCRSGEPHTPTRRRQGKEGESTVSEATKELFRLIVVRLHKTALTVLLSPQTSCAQGLMKA